jgi:hypothetical protein
MQDLIAPWAVLSCRSMVFEKAFRYFRLSFPMIFAEAPEPTARLSGLSARLMFATFAKRSLPLLLEHQATQRQMFLTPKLTMAMIHLQL